MERDDVWDEIDAYTYTLNSIQLSFGRWRALRDWGDYDCRYLVEVGEYLHDEASHKQVLSEATLVQGNVPSIKNYNN